MHVHNQHIFELRDDEMNAVEGKLKTTVACAKFETGWQTRCVIGNANVAKSPKRSMRDTKKC